MRDEVAPWAQTLKRTSSDGLLDDPDFDKLAPSSVPGRVWFATTLLWYADLPKCYAEAEVTAGRGLNLGERPGDGEATTKRLF